MECDHKGKYEYQGVWHCPHCGKDYDESLLEWIDTDYMSNENTDYEI